MKNIPNYSSECVVDLFLAEKAKNLIKVSEVVNLKTKMLTIYLDGFDKGVLAVKPLTSDEIFDKYEYYLTKEQVKNLFKNNE